MFASLINTLKTYRWFWVGVVIILLVSFLEEEAIFDLSDWTVFQIIVVIVALASIFYDNLWKYLSGQSLELDRSSFVYGFIKALLMLFYFGIIWFGFFLHSVEPLLIGSSDESIPVVYLYDIIVAHSVTVCIIGLSTLAVRCLYFLINESTIRVLLSFVLITTYVFVCGSLFVASLRLLSKTTGSDISTNVDVVESSSTRLYSATMSKDGYDWHATVPRQVDFNFVDVAVFFWYILCLILVLSVVILIICFYFNIIISALTTNLKTNYITKNLALYNTVLVGFKHLIMWVSFVMIVQGFITARCLLLV